MLEHSVTVCGHRRNLTEVCLPSKRQQDFAKAAVSCSVVKGKCNKTIESETTLTIARHKSLIRMLTLEPDLTVSEISEKLAVSQATVRRDLKQLSEEGLIQRVRSGATIAKSLGVQPSWIERSKVANAQKRAIAKVASHYIHDGQVIALDVGTTALEIAKQIQLRSNISVFTASVPIAEVLATEYPMIYLIGGMLRPREMAVVGPMARENVKRFHFDTFFLAAGAWSLDHGFMDFSIEDVEIKQAFMSSSEKIIAVTDSSKYDGTSLMSIAALSDVDLIITDNGLSEKDRKAVSDVTELLIAEELTEEGN